MTTTTKHCREYGFTLVEVMITMVISAIILAAIYSAYKFQRDTFEAQNQVTEMQQNIRNAMWIMVKEFRMAGYDPTQKASPEIAEAKQHRLRFTMDITNTAGTGDPDGDLDGPNEDVTFGFSDTNDPDKDGLIAGSGAASLGPNTGGGFQPIAENISAIEFNYILEDGTPVLNPTGFEISKIRAVEITVLARAHLPDRKFNNTMTYTTPGGQNWAFNDNYRRLLMTTTVQGRNL
ncbi:MAG: prepilin-type N-terminal cleavage/methylation domain-containing protein [Desulfobulbaceae bacterium]|nr:prepilin-type N-terminal cleavage/methylation domain-containing protein [Desulfobulbaceae bacterium]